MHAKFLRRSAHRRPDGSISLPKLAASKAEVRDIVDPLLNGPVTLTVTVIHRPTGDTPVSTSSDEDEPTVLPLPPVTQVTSVLPTAVSSPVVPIPHVTSTNTVPTQSPVLSISDLPPTPITTATNPNSSSASLSPSPSGWADTPAAEDNGATTVNLSSGAVAGIVIGCLFVLVAATVFGLRKRSMKNRSRLRGMWASSKALRLGGSGNGSGFGIFGARGGPAPTPHTYQPSEEFGGAAMERQRDLEGVVGEGRMSYVGGRPVTATFAGAAVGTGARNSVSARTMSTLGLGLPKGLPTAYGYAESISSPLRSTAVGDTRSSAVVARTFITSLPDELAISTGEALEIIEIFDDGWAECANRNGDIGMVPLECFDRVSFAPRGLGGTIMAGSPVTNENGMSAQEMGSRNSRRYTSLPSARR